MLQALEVSSRTFSAIAANGNVVARPVSMHSSGDPTERVIDLRLSKVKRGRTPVPASGFFERLNAPAECMRGSIRRDRVLLLLRVPLVARAGRILRGACVGTGVVIEISDVFLRAVRN